MIYTKVKVPKSHDLSNILDKCVEINKEFEILYPNAENLTPYSTAFRYMDIGMGIVPSHDLVEEAKNDSLEILNFIKQLID